VIVSPPYEDCNDDDYSVRLINVMNDNDVVHIAMILYHCMPMISYIIIDPIPLILLEFLQNVLDI
jgi:hypothetical protein